MKENVVCSECGVVLTEGNVHEFDSHIMCEDCFDRVTVTCDNCGIDDIKAVLHPVFEKNMSALPL